MPHEAAAQALNQVTFSIPAGSLSGALAAFGRQAGLQVTYLPEIASGMTSPGVSGALAPNDALARILQGSGLSYSFTNAKTVTITDRVSSAHTPVEADGSLVLDTIEVSGGQGGGVYSPFETAAPTDYISEEDIDRFRGSSPADIFRGTPGVMSGEARNGAGSVDVNIRGMQGFGRVTTTIDGAENAVTVYQGYQGLSNRTFVDPDFIAGIDITKGADVASWGNAGSVAMRTVSADDIVKPGETWGIRVKGEFGTNSSEPETGNRAGYLISNPIGSTNDPNSGYGSATPSATGMDRPSFLSPTNGSGSVVGAYKSEDFDLLAGYARRERGNYHAGKNGPSADPVSTGSRPFCYTNGTCPEYLLYRDYVENAGLVNYRGGEEVLNTQLDTESWLTKLTARFADDQTLQLGYTGFRSEAGDRMASALTSDMGQAIQQAQTAGTSLDTVTARYRWDPEDNDLIDLKSNFYWTHLELRNPIRGGRGIKPEQIGLPPNFRTGSDTDMWGADITNLSKFNLEYGDLDLTYGLSYRAEDTRGSKHAAALEGWLTPRDGIRHEAAGFAKAAYTPVDWLTLNAGLRYSHFWSKDRVDPYERSQIEGDRVVPGFKTDAGGFSPSIGVTLEPIDGTQFYVNYSNAMRAPSIIESVSAFNSVVANAAVKPERSSNWEVGTNLMRDGLVAEGDRGMLKFGYFNWDVKDYLARNIAFDPANPGSLSLNIENIDRARFSGLELSGRYEVGGFTAELAANYFLNVEYCRTADTCGAKTLYGDYATNHVQPEYTVGLTLSQKLLEERMTLGGRISYVGPRAIGHGDVTAQGLSQFIAPINWDPYTLVDVFAEYKVSDSLTASVRVENLFDRFYVDPLGLVAQPGPGRTFFAGLEGTFGGSQTLPQLGPFFGQSANPTTGAIDWSGFYAGVHGGGAFGRTWGTTTAADGTPDAIAATESADLDLNGALFGVQAGYNWQLGNGLVLGLEADWSKTFMLQAQQKARAIEGTLADEGALQAATGYDIDWTSGFRGRLGYAVDDRWMVYGTGGLALASETQWREQYRSTNYPTQGLGTETTILSTEKDKATRLGWTAGGGVEYALSDHWSIKADYGYTRFGKHNFTFGNARAGAAADYRTPGEIISVDIFDPMEIPQLAELCNSGVLPPDSCVPTEVTTRGPDVDHAGSSDIVNGRKASNSLDFHTFKVGLNYRF